MGCRIKDNRCLCDAKDCPEFAAADGEMGILRKAHQKVFTAGGRVEVDVPDLADKYERMNVSAHALATVKVTHG